MLTTFKTDTGLVLTVKVALFWKAFTLTLLGTPATDGSLLISVTDIPCQGAAPFKTTVPVDLVPPTTLVGVRVTETRLVAALAGLDTNPEMANKAVKIMITNINPLCFNISSSSGIVSSFLV
jgi:hypothetical protein